MKSPFATPLFRSVALFAVIAFSANAHSAKLTIHVADVAGAPAADAVVYAEAATGKPAIKPGNPATIEQKGRMFLPAVTVIQTGTSVSFPNHDTVRHQVYSFSPAKVFELKLYSGTSSEPMVFDKPGTVVIGCNIHDQMVAYIQVVDTPWFGKTDSSGKAVIENLPAGKYVLKVWHRAFAPGAAIPEQLVTVSNSDITMPLSLAIKTDKK
ncbi:methylamine utilization protein [Actimicrobium antarcticum]|uniref:Methylamine utilization protein n=1 Tax=Actimicrobium antarcticum TaxID=1051899 RepID=A0ABP7SRN6_9BURK